MPDSLPKIRKYTLPILLERAHIIHGEKYDYSAITDEDIKGCTSKIPLRCKSCEHRWSPTISDHITKHSGCPKCTGRIRYTLKSFVEKATDIHGDKYDYSAITEDHIKGKNSKVPLKCNLCRYEWSSSISVHIRAKNGCRMCANALPWTLGRFLKRANEIHGDKYDYSMILEKHIRGGKSKVPIICNFCSYSWEPCINNHINSKSG